MRNGARSKRNYQGARGKIKKEQGAKSDEKGAVKIGRKELHHVSLRLLAT